MQNVETELDRRIDKLFITKREFIEAITSNMQQKVQEAKNGLEKLFQENIASRNQQIQTNLKKPPYQKYVEKRSKALFADLQGIKNMVMYSY